MQRRRFRITVNGREYDVAVEEMSEAASPAAPAPQPSSAAAPAPQSAGASARPATLPASAPAPSAADGDEVAQLAGVVVLVDAVAGNTVQQGDRLLLLEAMKMKTPVIASRSGRIIRVLVKAGDAVEGGQPLVTIA
ncbi:MAG TPA: biotin/lipoyl-containing protein [Rhodocyclaceae bacterium]|jgi:biotin carboxyl carrier protein|nr:biotin/lipoyl-containing protein [Rhodocyclaceae bacterium]